jgi:DNA-binding CsgD family transcriptional regulator
MLSVALTSGGIILSSRLRSKYKSESFSILLYYQVFIFTFGFYGIWGHVVIKAFLSSYISAELMDRFSDFVMLFGLPFLVFAWLMLIQFSLSLSGRKNNNWFIFVFLVVNIIILIIVGYYIAGGDRLNTSSLIRRYYIVMNLVYTLWASLMVHFPLKGKSLINEYDRRIIAPVLFITMLIQSSLLIIVNELPYAGLIFIFVFFSGNTFLPVWFSYGTLSIMSTESVKDMSLADFCRKYEISPRETEVIQEICNGLSNKEISEKLFISLQTVKDHTHRIYNKTNVRGRVHLINLIKGKISN